MKSLVALVATLLIGSLAACELGPSAQLIDLLDPETGAVIGTKDPSTGEYVFDDGLVVVEDEIDRTAGSALAEKEGALLAKKPVWQSPGGRDHSSGGSSGGSGSCWNMKEGSLQCSGCCIYVGVDTYTCWESCYDASSSGGMAM